MLGLGWAGPGWLGCEYLILCFLCCTINVFILHVLVLVLEIFYLIASRIPPGRAVEFRRIESTNLINESNR